MGFEKFLMFFHEDKIRNLVCDKPTVFCTASDADDEANTTKFNSPGWSGSFGCPQDIDTIAFPTNNTVLAGMS
jgi:hypothetical protein